MALPWQTIARHETPEGVLELRQRGAGDFLITFGGLVLMNSRANRSEVALGHLACKAVAGRSNPRVLVGGLGMAITLRAVLDDLPPTARVVVAELNPVILDWCRGPLATLTATAVADPRVTVEIGDVADVIRRSASPAAEKFDSVILDLYTGPDADCHPQRHPLYGSQAIARTRAALKGGGIFAVWGESRDAGFENRLCKAGFEVTSSRPGKGGLRHVVYLALATAPATSRPANRNTNKATR